MVAPPVQYGDGRATKARLLVVAALVCVSVNSGAKATTYTLTELGPPQGASRADAIGINNSGQEVGSSGTGAASNATIWNGTTPTALGSLPGVVIGTDVNAINNAGLVGGTTHIAAGPGHGTLSIPTDHLEWDYPDSAQHLGWK
jgi:hypothetical protein